MYSGYPKKARYSEKTKAMPFKKGECVQNRYMLQKTMGSNGSRQTWLGEDLLTSGLVTFKCLYFGEDTQWRDLRLLEREVAMLKSLDHPRIPSFIDAFWEEKVEGHYCCLVQRYIPGDSLAERLAGGERLNFEAVKYFVRSMLLILEYLHNQLPPVVHRDLKPSNIVVGADGEYYLIDFGAVKATDEQNRTITVVGTFGYAAMEQFAGRSVPASDLYGLGQTIVHLLTGKNPADLQLEELELFLRYSPSLDASFRKWLSKMIEPDVRNRYSSASEALIAFNEVLSGTSSLASNQNLFSGSSDSEVSTQLNSLGIRLELEPKELRLEIPGCSIFDLDFNWFLQNIWMVMGMLLWSGGMIAALPVLGVVGSFITLPIGIVFFLTSFVTFVASLMGWIYTIDNLLNWLAPTFGFRIYISPTGYRVKCLGMRSRVSQNKGLYQANELQKFEIRVKNYRSHCTLNYRYTVYLKSEGIKEREGTYWFGSNLTEMEQKWLVEKMNLWLNEAKQHWTW
jgi:serine/threonine protein kinase